MSFAIVDRKNICVKTKEPHKNFVKIYEDAVFRSKSTKAEKFAPEIFVREYIEKLKHKESNIRFGCCSFAIFFLFLLIYSVCVVDKYDGTASKIWIHMHINNLFVCFTYNRLFLFKTWRIKIFCLRFHLKKLYALKT